eukprot:scaffold17019_cov54-Phaeocystis_antarctica.AAC.2
MRALVRARAALVRARDSLFDIPHSIQRASTNAHVVDVGRGDVQRLVGILRVRRHDESPARGCDI